MEGHITFLEKLKNSSVKFKVSKAIEASFGQIPSCLSIFLKNQMSQTVITKIIVSSLLGHFSIFFHYIIARLTEEQLKQIEQFRKSHVPPRNILRFFQEQNVSCACTEIYNVVAKIKKNRMQGRNIVAEVLCLSAQRGYTVFYRNGDDSNILSDIVIAHQTSIAMIRTWPYVLIMDTTYETNMLRHTDGYFNKSSTYMFHQLCQLATNQFLMMDVFSKSYHMLCRRHIDQNVLAKLTEMIKDEEVATRFVNGFWHKLINKFDEAEYRRKLDGLKTKWQRRLDFFHYLFNTWLYPLAHKFCRVWTFEVLHFGVEITNRTNESEHSVLKLWLSTCHGDLDTMFLNID
ncbi:hypothetical protein M9H77_31498 [Catharanthus roseus]|uniref:Uncharacterized protein n=1 Tax=Catharanthus roseus TaxID=4058 RepID=A0ACC0A0M8_CATRO|nr:hypothetical protein M9H77_31498 [Catharanthus roseus]